LNHRNVEIPLILELNKNAIYTCLLTYLKVYYIKFKSRVRHALLEESPMRHLWATAFDIDQSGAAAAVGGESPRPMMAPSHFNIGHQMQTAITSVHDTT